MTTVPLPEEIEIPTRVRNSIPARLWQLAPRPVLRVADITPYCTSRREFLIGATGLLLLPAGCGSDEQSDATGETRTIEHELGSTEVPLRPRRVVALDASVIPDALLALDHRPVGATPSSGESYPSWLEGEMQSVESVGRDGEPNLEAVANLEPDLILGYDYHEDVYAELSEIAPTVAVRGSVTQDWKIAFRKIAETVGEEEQAEDIVAGYEQRLEEFCTETRDRLEGATVSLVNLREDELRLYGEGSYPAEILRDAGLKAAPQPEVEGELGDLTDGRIISLSLELIPEIQGDYIFLIAYDVDEDRLETLTQSGLWQGLDAVREDRVFMPEQALAYTNGGPLGANEVVDDLFEYLTGESS